MITIDSARKELEKKYPSVKAKYAYEYGDSYYLFVAPANENMNEPYYLVNKNDGKCRWMNPLEDFDLFIDATKNHFIRNFDEEHH